MGRPGCTRVRSSSWRSYGTVSGGIAPPVVASSDRTSPSSKRTRSRANTASLRCPTESRSSSLHSAAWPASRGFWPSPVSLRSPRRLAIESDDHPLGRPRLQFGIARPSEPEGPIPRVRKGFRGPVHYRSWGGAVDALDVRLFRDLLQSPASSPMGAHFRTSFGAIAKKVGVDEETVRHRIRRFHQDGLISGWRTIMNPAILGGGLYGIIFDVNPAIRKDEVIEAARLIPGMFLIVSFHV